MPRSCEEFKTKEDSWPLWVATENYMTCRQKAGFYSKCSTVHVRFFEYFSIIETTAGQLLHSDHVSVYYAI